MVISNAGTVVAAISAVNECVTFFQWVKSLWSHRNRTENQEDGVPKLQSSLGAHSSGTEKQELKQDDVLKLQSSLYTLSGMYSFTDQAQVLPELKAAVCNMQDLLEDFRCYQQQKAKTEGSATSAEPGTKFFHDFIQSSSSKLIHIQQRLHNQYRLLEGISLHQATPRFNRSVRPETTSFPTEAKIFGRDDEIKELIRILGVPDPFRLKRKRSATITSVPVLPIVGIGGVGKTTLAQIVCHHPQVRKHFDVIVWLCVSDEFDVKRLTKEAIEKFSGEAVTKDNVDSLQVDLAQSINKRRFLVVLDDMWSENGELWKRFYVPFKHVPQGSMMLVTTRSVKVAFEVGTVDPFLLVGLKNDILHKFFKQCAFGSDSSNHDPVLEWIGKQIVSKLKGSLLFAKIFGRMLGMCLDPAYWNMILTSQLWELREKETGIIVLSYINLPHHLKSCYLFCGMFPKEDIIELWLAEGFVLLNCKYFKGLAHRSFFQKLHGKFVIHNLVHDMAVLKEEYFIIGEENDFERIPWRNVPAREPQHSASTSASTQAPTSHTDIPPMWPPPMPSNGYGFSGQFHPGASSSAQQQPPSQYQ